MLETEQKIMATDPHGEVVVGGYCGRRNFLVFIAGVWIKVDY